MAENASTPSGVSNGYLKNLKSHDDVPSVYTTDLSIDKNREELLESYSGEGDAFSGETGTAIVAGDDIALGEVTLLVGNLAKDAPGKSYKDYKEEKMEKSEKDKLAREEEAKKNDRDNDGIDDRME